MPSVLVIDDEAAIRDSIQQVLEKRGYTVSTADNGADGVDSFLRDGADLIIADIMMPRSDGIAVIRRIRSTHAETPIIAITGGGNFQPAGYNPESALVEGFLILASQCGADAVLTKPFRREQLISTVRSLIPGGSLPN
jgi:two-component system response regulator RegX3